MERNINKGVAPKNINRYPGIQDPEIRRQAISQNRQEKIARGELQVADTQHNYSGDPILVELDQNRNWKSDFFVLTK